jgi:hypothetical protein
MEVVSVHIKSPMLTKLRNSEKFTRGTIEYIIRTKGNQCCGSGMFIPDPDFYPSWIPDLGSRNQKQQQQRWMKKKIVVIPFFVATNFTKLKIILFLKCWRK